MYLGNEIQEKRMIPFLYNIAKTYYGKYSDTVGNYIFVFPNRRAGIFFQKYLSEIAGKPIFSPQIYTISDLTAELSTYRKVDRIESLFLLYDIYKKVSSTDESFDEFLYWGEMLLNDFDDIDKYLVDAKQLFQNIKDLKDIDAGFSFLEPEQIEVIRRFWSNFLPVLNNDKKKQFLEIWEVLFHLYSELRSELHANGLAYEGMIFRNVAEKSQKGDISIDAEKIVFIGLNGHSKSEDALLKYFRDQGIADFYWDYSSPLIRDAKNKASLFVDYNRSNYKSRLNLMPEEQTLDKPILEVIGIPSSIGQAKYVHKILENLLNSNEITAKNEGLNTAVILPDENLLLPVLYSLPSDVSKINVTMGYSLSNTSISGLVGHIIELQKNVRKANQKGGFYYRNVDAILSHRYIMDIVGVDAKLLLESIFKFNKVIVPASDLEIHPILKKIFVPVGEWYDIPDYLRSILSSLQSYFYVQRGVKGIRDDLVRSIDLENEFIVEYYKTINKMDEFLKGNLLDMSVDTYFKLLKKMIAGVSVPFNGEPLSGLQIMGVLETRTLDFDNLIILNMNEGVFPVKRTASSFIPYNLRQGFDLPTYEYQDGIYAYHFYRIINRAKRIYLLYDSRTEGLNSGEVSRFFTQIKHLYSSDFEIKEKIAVYKIPSNESPVISVAKNRQIMEKLHRFLQGGDRSLSASSINMYLNCPLQFYLSVVEKMEEEKDVSETVESSMFGTIYHYIMENIYHPLEGKMITADVLESIYKNEKYLTGLIEKSFAENYFKSNGKIKELTGQNYLTGEVLRKYIKQTLQVDKKLTPFIYLESEKRIKKDYELPSGKIVSLKSFIDRVDNVRGRTRIIDYKTGKGELSFRKIEDLFDKTHKNRPKAIMQVFLYAHLYLMEEPEQITEPGIYYLRDLFSKNFNSCVIYNRDSKVENFAECRNDFAELLHSCLDEIFDMDTPFAQTPTSESCRWCTFINICGK